MQMAEVERLQKEIAYREELAANHGKPKSFWKVPALNTLKRRHDRKESDSSGAQFLRPLRLTKSQHRPNKFDLDENTLMLKKLLQERSQELKKYFVAHPAVHSSQ